MIGFEAAAPPDVGMHRVALDRPGPDQRDLDGEVVEVARLQPRQRRHLRPRLDLEHADRVGGAEHVVDARRLLRDRVEVVADAVRGLDELEAVLQCREHPEPEQVELHQPDRGAVVLVPLQHGAAGHPAPLDRAHLDDRPVAHHHAAGMDAEMPRRVLQLPGHVSRPLAAACRESASARRRVGCRSGGRCPAGLTKRSGVQ